MGSTSPGAGGVMTYLPAPYETPPQDDLVATLAAVLTTTVAVVSAWVLGSWAYSTIRGLLDATGLDDLTIGSGQAGLLALGWALSALLLGVGALLVLFRRGRKL